jgi:prenyltransferase beta subunit
MNESVQKSKKEIGKANHLPELSRVIQYLKDREYEEGGFSFVQDLYPNVEDTYYAIRTLQLLMADIDRIKTANYLKSIIWEEVYFSRIVYMLLYLHLSADMELPVPLVNLLKKDWSRFQFLDAQYYSNEIQKLLNQPLKPLLSSSPFQFHRQENLQSLRKKISVLLDNDVDFDRQEIIRWVQLSQSGDGGFGFYPETKTSYMENIFCALEILSKLQASPWRIDACREYILGCQTKSGGYGRAPISFPFIESTFQAVAGLLMLEEMERGNK